MTRAPARRTIQLAPDHGSDRVGLFSDLGKVRFLAAAMMPQRWPGPDSSPILQRPALVAPVAGFMCLTNQGGDALGRQQDSARSPTTLKVRNVEMLAHVMG